MQKNDELSWNLVRFLKTKDETECFSNELTLLLKALYITGKDDFAHTEKSKIRSSTFSFLEDLFVKQNIDKKNLDTTFAFINQIQQYIQNCSILELKIAFEPSLATKDLIISWLDKNLPEPLLVDIKTEEQIIAGCILTFKGIYKDYSLTESFMHSINMAC